MTLKLVSSSQFLSNTPSLKTSPSIASRKSNPDLLTVTKRVAIEDIDSEEKNSRRRVSTRISKKNKNMNKTEGVPPNDAESEEEEDTKGSSSGKGNKDTGGKSRRELPAGAVATLKQWLLSPEHFTHPYPTPQDQALLMQKTGIDKKQLKNWFTNARRRIWKPMLKKQLEQGKLAATGSGGGGVAVTGLVLPGLVQTSKVGGSDLAQSNLENPQALNAMQAHYQQALQQQQNSGFEIGSNNLYKQHQQNSNSQLGNNNLSSYFINQSGYTQQQQNSNNQGTVTSVSTMTGNNSTLQPMNGQSNNLSRQLMNKTDSHAVLMELFARDQDLVRQAAEGAKFKASAAIEKNNLSNGSNMTQQQQQQQQQQVASQHPMKMGNASRMGSVPALNSWPHFSSVSSLNNLGTLTGVKSITNMSGADLASQGNLNKKGNLAQVKSFESMGRTDSYAFLEVFFDDRSNPTGNWSNRQVGMKREREEDTDIGLSIEDDVPSSSSSKPYPPVVQSTTSAAPRPAPLPPDNKDKPGVPPAGSSDNGSLKRAFDDALAARGLMSVSRSSEKLTDLALPAKMRRTLSQEILRQQQIQSFPSFTASGGDQAQPQASGPIHPQNPTQSELQYPGQHPGQQQTLSTKVCVPAPLSDPSMNNASVEVPTSTKCALCGCINVDTQLRPCGHMFHGRCLKPSLQNAMGPPTCPIDHIPMQSAVLAVPTDESSSAQQNSQHLQQQGWDGNSGNDKSSYTTPIPSETPSAS